MLEKSNNLEKKHVQNSNSLKVGLNQMLNTMQMIQK